MDKLLGVTSGQFFTTISKEIRTELFRKTIHMMVGLVPIFAAINLGFTMAMLGALTMVYTYAEVQRLNGNAVPIIGKITMSAARERDAGKIVLGPITLAIGCMLALLMYPNPAATIGIFALAFGDGLSSLVGKIFGSIKIPFTGGKSLEGSLACFIAVFAVCFNITRLSNESFVIASWATLLEALPTKDMDNIIIPVGTGMAASIMLNLM